MRDSQAGQCCGRKLGLFLGSNDKQDDSSHQRESSEDWGNGHSVMLFCCGVNRPQFRHLLQTGHAEWGSFLW